MSILKAIGAACLSASIAACSSRAGEAIPAEGTEPPLSLHANDVAASAMRDRAPSAQQTTSFGDPLPGLTPDEQARFTAGRTAFMTTEAIADGLGPVFNNTACGACHSGPVTGGGSTFFETRFGTTHDGTFDPLTELGGSLIQSQGIGVITVDDHTCDFVGEVVPSVATIQAGRLATPLFGLGLVDAVPDGTFIDLAARQARSTPATAGIVAIVPNLSAGTSTVGKFGWKAQNPTLFQFAGDAYVNEMGITNPQFPTENCPQGNCALLVCDPVPDPEDDGTDVRLFTDFMTFLGAPPSSPPPSTQAGRAQFDHAGCADCHTPQLTTGPNAVAALDRKTFAPYSDFLLHDMGALGDGITQNNATGALMRTAPLWGAGVRARFLHDGRATTIAQAILAHDGQGVAARDRFAKMAAAQQRLLVTFVSSL